MTVSGERATELLFNKLYKWGVLFDIKYLEYNKMIWHLPYLEALVKNIPTVVISFSMAS